MKAAVVLNKTQFPEFIHEEIDPGARGPDHLRQHLLRHLGKHFLRLALFAAGGRAAHTADAEGADADEYSIGQCAE